jgi:hypothetical protein
LHRATRVSINKRRGETRQLFFTFPISRAPADSLSPFLFVAEAIGLRRFSHRSNRFAGPREPDGDTPTTRRSAMTRA